MITEKEVYGRARKAVYSEKFQEMFKRGFLPWYKARGQKIEDVKNYYVLLGQMRVWGGKKFRGTRKQQEALMYEAKERGIPTPKPRPRARKEKEPVRVQIPPKTRTVLRYRYKGRLIQKPRRYNILINAVMQRIKIKGRTQTVYRHKSGEFKGRYMKKADVQRRVMYKDTKTGKIIGKPTRKKYTYTIKTKDNA